MDCVFCKIIAGEIPCSKVYEDEKTLAFLDIAPANLGHTLVIPKHHAGRLEDLPEAFAVAVMKTVQKVGKAVASLHDDYNIIQNNGLFAGQVVPHVHFHVIPRFEQDKLHISVWNEKKYNEGEMETFGNRLREVLNG